MTDNLSPKDRKKTMRAVKSQNTGPERKLRGMLAGLGLRGWRLNYKDIPGKPDFAFPEEKVAIFVDGCFWHGCPHCNRPLPKKNQQYWERKIDRNIERDKKYNEQLAEQGWKVIRVWGHQLKNKNEYELIAEKILKVLEKR